MDVIKIVDFQKFIDLVGVIRESLTWAEHILRKIVEKITKIIY